jgi:hypothetical protein
MEKSKVKKVRYIGKIPVMDITVDSDEHLFFANGIATSNCAAHAKAYSVYSAVQLWLQDHYFLEYMCALLSHIDRAKEKKGVGMLNERVEYCIKHGTYIYYPLCFDIFRQVRHSKRVGYVLNKSFVSVSDSSKIDMLVALKDHIKIGEKSIRLVLPILVIELFNYPFASLVHNLYGISSYS